jgi:diguanylate cyclase (GGDEF)-like protein/PAS domain S-box-containing protein
MMPDNQPKVTVRFKRPNRLIYKLLMVTLITLSLIFLYQLIINFFVPNLSELNYFIITVLSICLTIDLAACLILYRYQSLIDQVEEEIVKRCKSEESLRKTNYLLENQIKQRIVELEETNKGLHHEIMEREQIEDDLRGSEEKYRLLVSSMPGTVFKGYVDWEVDFFDDKVLELTGYKRSDFDSREITWDSVIIKEDLKNVKDAFIRALNTDKSYVREYRIKSRQGEPRWIQERGQIICDAGGGVEYISGVFFDISERKQAEAALQAANAKLQTLWTETAQQNQKIILLNEMTEFLQTCQEPTEIYDAVVTFAGRFFPSESGALYILNNSKNLLDQVAIWGGDPPQESILTFDDCWALRRSRLYHYEKGCPGLPCKHASQESLLDSICVPMIAQGEVMGMLHLQISNNGGKSAQGSPEALFETRQGLAVSFAEHIGVSLANLRLRESLRTQAIRDPLTGLFNRRYMEETMERECARVKRLDISIGIIMMDFDHFKQYNDTFGHNMGDTLLRQFGAWLKSQKRVEDIACRFGGEEFILILPGTTADVAYKRAEKLRLGVKRLRLRHNNNIDTGVSLSLGVAVFPDHGSTVEEIIAAADMAMYQAKKDGRDRVVKAQSVKNPLVDYSDKVFHPAQTN